MKRIIHALLILAICTFGAQSPASAAPPISVSGSSTANSGGMYAANVFVSPRKSGVSVSLFRVSMGSRVKLGTARTNSVGRAVIKFKVTTSTFKLQASLTNKLSTKSSIFVVSVQTPSTVRANLPATMGCEETTVTALVTPKTSGREVQLQWYDGEDGIWVTESTATTDSQGVAYLTLGTADSEGTWDHRVVLSAKGSMKSAVTPPQSIYFEDCSVPSGWDFTATAESGLSLYTGDWFEVSWSFSADFRQFIGENVSVILEICDDTYGSCDPADPDMPYYHQDFVNLSSDYSSTFNWLSEYGDWMVRVSIWDNGEMLDYKWANLSVS